MLSHDQPRRTKFFCAALVTRPITSPFWSTTATVIGIFRCFSTPLRRGTAGCGEPFGLNAVRISALIQKRLAPRPALPEILDKVTDERNEETSTGAAVGNEDGIPSTGHGRVGHQPGSA
jgi:hypothetical protein